MKHSINAWILTAMLILAGFSQNTVAQIKNEIPLSEQQVIEYLSQPDEQFKLPIGTNGDITFTLHQTHVMAKELEVKYPEIKTYSGYDSQNPERRIILTKTASSIRAVIEDRGKIFRFEPKAPGLYTYYQDEAFGDEQCGYSPEHISKEDGPLETIAPNQTKALWPTGGYGTTHYTIQNVLMPMSGNFAIDYNITTVVDGLAFTANFVAVLSAKYEMEIGIGFQLHPNNDEMIFLNASDPYPDYPTAVDSNLGGPNSFLNRNQVICDSMIGNANYNYSIVLCRVSTARGTYTAPCSTTYKGKVTCFNSIFALYHEVGHTFTCPHTYALTPDNGYNPYIMRLEQTTMGTLGQFFACTSIETVAEWALAGNNITCAVQTPSGNSAPQISGTVDGKYMPANTPFVLANTNSTDADGDPLYYSWQSTDGYQPEFPDTAFTDPDEYLIFAPERPSLTGNIRYVPFLEYLVSGEDDPYSHLPWVTRDMNVRCLVRDSVGGVNMTFETVHIDGNSGPFMVSTPIAGDVVTEMQAITVNWDVANTTAAPVSATTVDILLSTDGGVSFNNVILAGTPNDGSQAVTIPNGTATTEARIMVRGNGIFFNINPANFTIYDNALPPDFAIFAYDTVGRACDETMTYEFIAQDLSGFGSPITFTVSGLPAGVASSFPQTVDPGDHVFLTLSDITTALHGTYPITVTATGNSVSKSRELSLVIAGEIQVLNNYAMSAISTSLGSRYQVPDLTGDFPEYTVEYWIKFDPIAMGVLSSSIYWGTGYILKNANDKIEMQVSNGTYGNFTSSLDEVVPNRWYHVAGTYKNKTVTLYVDGVRQGEGSYDDGILPAPWQYLHVGSLGSWGISGQVDELRIWNKIHTGDQIRKHMHLNLSPEEVCSGEVLFYMQFEQDSSQVYDVTGNYGTITIHNGPSSVISDCPTASGVSVLKTISATGNVSFDDANVDTDVDITFNANPNGEVVVSKLYSVPNGTQPTFGSMNPNFWIVRNFGDTALDYNAEVAFTDVVFNTTPTAANYTLKQRPSFKAVGAWESAIVGSSFSSDAIGFNGLDEFGHFTYGIDDDLYTAELEEDGWVLYPNPTNENVTIVFKNNTERLVVLVNTLGEHLFSGLVKEKMYELPLGGLSAGVYYVCIVEQEENSIKKLIVNSEK